MIDFNDNPEFQAALKRHSKALDSLQEAAVFWGLTENDEIASGFALEFAGNKDAMILATVFASLIWNTLNPDGSDDQKSKYLAAVKNDYFLGAVQSITWHHDQGASEYNHRFLLVLRGLHEPNMETSNQAIKSCETMTDQIIADKTFPLTELGLFEFNDSLPHRVTLTKPCDPERPLLFVSFPTWAESNSL